MFVLIFNLSYANALNLAMAKMSSFGKVLNFLLAIIFTPRVLIQSKLSFYFLVRRKRPK